MQPSRTRRFLPSIAVLAGLAVIAVVATQGGGAPASTTAPLPPSPVVGIVVAVDSEGLGQVRGFSLLTPGDNAYDLVLGPLENAAEFSPAHLAEHMATSEPVRVFYRLENGSPVVYRVEDAPAG
jgi:hypothetical protein